MKYKVNDRVRIKSLDWYNTNKDEYGDISCGEYDFVEGMKKFCSETLTISEDVDDGYLMLEDYHRYVWTNEMIEGLVEDDVDLIPKFGEYSDNEPLDMGEVSDGYHTFNELYEYRMLYNAALFNEFAKQGLYDVHKSRKHSDGEYPFGDSNWFIVMAELPTGQISNHYEMKDWDKFQIPEKPLANKWDEHSPRDVADRLTSFTNPKKDYPKTYEECLSVLGIYNGLPDVEIYNAKPLECKLFESLIRLKRCRDTYWKLYGEEMGFGYLKRCNMATLTKKDLLEAIEDMPENLEVWTQTNALCYEVNRVELKTLWVGKEKKTVILFHGKHVPLC